MQIVGRLYGFRSGAAGIIDAVRPGPCAQKGEARAQTPLETGLEGVIFRIAPWPDGYSIAEIRVRTARRDGARTRNGLVDVLGNEDMRDLFANIGDRKNIVRAQLPLKVNVPLGCALCLEVPWIVDPAETVDREERGTGCGESGRDGGRAIEIGRVVGHLHGAIEGRVLCRRVI